MCWTSKKKIIEAIEQGNLTEIQGLLDQVLLSIDPDQLYEIAELLVFYGFLNEAEQIYAHLHFLFPEEVQLTIDHATLLMDRGDEDEALNMLLSIPSSAPEYPQVLLALADYYQMQGLYEVSELRINEALKLLPNEPLLQFAKAELLMEMGKLIEASRLYEELVIEHEEIAGIRLVERLAEVYRSGGAYEKALEFYLKALDDQVTPDLLFGGAYSAFQTEQYETAIRQLEDLKELDPDYFAGYLLLAQCYAMQEDNKKAYAIIREGIARDEYDKELYLFAGKIALKNNLPEEAEHYLRQAVALDPEYMEALHVLVSLLAESGQHEYVIELIEQLRKDDFDWSTLYPYAAEAYNCLEQYNRAYDFYSLAYNEYKEDPVFLEKYVYFLFEEGKQHEAHEVVKQLVKLQPDEPRWLELLYTFE